jgi:hypothetical protein
LETRDTPGQLAWANPPVAGNPSAANDIPGFREPVQTNNSVIKRQFSDRLRSRSGIHLKP